MIQCIDTQGLSCPQPVLLVRQVLAETKENATDVLVDTEASHENVTRAAEKMGWTVNALDQGQGVHRLELRK